MVRSRECLCHVTQGGSIRFGLDWRRSMILSFVEFIIADCLHKSTEKLMSFCVCEVVKVKVVVDSNGL